MLRRATEDVKGSLMFFAYGAVVSSFCYPRVIIYIVNLAKKSMQNHNLNTTHAQRPPPLVLDLTPTASAASPQYPSRGRPPPTGSSSRAARPSRPPPSARAPA